MTTALLVVLTSPVEGREDEYHDWYTQHLADVLSAAGFSAAQRFAFVPTTLSRHPVQPFLAIYEVDADRRELTERLLLETAATPAMPISDALGPTTTWWFEPISDRVQSST